MSNSVTEWIAGKLVSSEKLEISNRIGQNLLQVKANDDYEFLVGVLGVKGVIQLSDVAPLFTAADRPDIVVNVPSKSLWSGAAIHHIHANGAAFGTFGDISRAGYTDNVGSYRDKNMGFFVKSIAQHSNVSSLSYVYDRVFRAERKIGGSLVIAVIDTYNMSAEDVRNAQTQFGKFDIVVKSSSHGSITYQAEAAAKSMGIEALTFGELMRRLAK
jgi:hypothetical protein